MERVITREDRAKPAGRKERKATVKCAIPVTRMKSEKTGLRNFIGCFEIVTETLSKQFEEHSLKVSNKRGNKP